MGGNSESCKQKQLILGIRLLIMLTKIAFDFSWISPKLKNICKIKVSEIISWVLIGQNQESKNKSKYYYKITTMIYCRIIDTTVKLAVTNA